MKKITIMQDILEANQKKAEEINKLLNKKNIIMLNMIGSPGCGKTSILELTAKALKKYKIAVIEGDITTNRDAQRLMELNLSVAQINTNGSCHLESVSIEKALESFNLDEIELIFVENVGNLVCPAEFDIGEHAKVAVISTTEGDDKPMKYPLLFHEAKAVILNKTDLAPFTNFNEQAFLEDLKKLNPTAPIFKISCTKETGLDDWYEWIKKII